MGETKSFATLPGKSSPPPPLFFLHFLLTWLPWTKCPDEEALERVGNHAAIVRKGGQIKRLARDPECAGRPDNDRLGGCAFFQPWKNEGPNLQ